MNCLLLLGLYFGIVWMIAAALLADQQGRILKVHGLARRVNEDYRDDLAFAVFVALIPLAWPSAPFITGFFQYGFNWKLARLRDKSTAEMPINRLTPHGHPAMLVAPKPHSTRND